MRIAAIVAGPAAGVLLWMFFRPANESPEILTAAAAVVIGLLAWMAIWWATQAVELAVTGLLPVVVLPLLGVSKAEQVLAPYANDVIFLFAGGCVLGLAIERHGLGRKLLMLGIRWIGHSPPRIVATFLVVSVLISAWVSNLATVAMMLPLASAALALYAVKEGSGARADKATRHFQHAVLLAVAYGASIGGVMTILGSPPNPIGAEWINSHGGQMDFVRWSSIGAPVGVLMLICALVIFRFVFPLHDLPQPVTTADAGESAPMSRAAKWTLLIFGLTVIAWVTAPSIKLFASDVVLKDGMIAIAAAVALFILPAERGCREPIVPWSQTQRLPWGVFILFGGGLSLADAMERTGVSHMIAQSASGMQGVPEVVIIATIAAVLVFASEVGSNTALAATAVPIVGAMAPGLGIEPEKLVITAVLGASLAFMLPVGTPPNALVFSTGLVPMREMMRVGFLLNLCSIVVITLICTYWL